MKQKQNNVSSEAHFSNNSPDELQHQDFVHRSVPDKLPAASPDVNYTPGNSKIITRMLMKEWKLKNEDYFTIYFENANDMKGDNKTASCNE